MEQNDGSDREILIAGSDARFELSVGDGDQGYVGFVAGAFSGTFAAKLRPDAIGNLRRDLAELRNGGDRTVTIYSEDARFEINIEPDDDIHAHVEVELRPPDGPELQLIYRFVIPFADIMVR